ncbi:MAG: site-2 protease family protein [Verrucomicrobiota bacterium]
MYSLKICRLFGIRLEVHFTFLLLLGYYAYIGNQYAGTTGALIGMATIILVFASVVLHELGHSLTAMYYGIPVPRIVLLPIGGMAQIAAIPKEPRKEFIITINGPLVNFALAILFFGILVWRYQNVGFVIDGIERAVKNPGWSFYNHLRSFQWESFVWILLSWNILMGLFNLLPIFPMDGGRIFRAILATRISYPRATFVAATLSKILAAAGIGYALLYSQNYLLVILLVTIWIAGEEEYKSVKRLQHLSGQTVADIMQGFLPSQEAELRATKHKLQADWPLDSFAYYIAAESGREFAVYHEGELVGLVKSDVFSLVENNE